MSIPGGYLNLNISAGARNSGMLHVGKEEKKKAKMETEWERRS